MFKKFLKKSYTKHLNKVTQCIEHWEITTGYSEENTIYNKNLTVDKAKYTIKFCETVRKYIEKAMNYNRMLYDLNIVEFDEFVNDMNSLSKRMRTFENLQWKCWCFLRKLNKGH